MAQQADVSATVRNAVAQLKNDSDTHYNRLCRLTPSDAGSVQQLNDIIQNMINDAILARMQLQPFLEDDGNNS